MLERFMNTAFGALIGQMVKERIRRGSIQAVKGYIQGVNVARYALMGLFGIGAVSAILVTGLLLVIIGIVGLLPIEATSMAITLLVIGLVLALVSGIGLIIAFNQKRWLEMSKSYELMDAVLAPWPGVLPPNPMEVVKGHKPVSRDSGVYDPTTPVMPSRDTQSDRDRMDRHTPVGDIGTGTVPSPAL